jgi:inner membrane protein
MRQSINRFRAGVTGKLVFIGVLALVLLIPLGMIEGLIAERARHKLGAAADIANSWGGAQTIGGPILVVPFRYKRHYANTGVETVTDELYVLPQELAIDGEATTDALKRGLYAVPVYNATLSVSGLARPANLESSDYPELEILWRDAVFALPLADPRSIRAPVRMTLAGTAVDFQAGGVRVAGFGTQLIAPLAAFGLERLDGAEAFSLEVTIAGTETLRFLPLGAVTRVSVESDWPSPRFTGAFLPEQRTVAADGFSATWRVLDLGRGYPSTWKRSDGAPQLQSLATASPAGAVLPVGYADAQTASFGVDMVVPIGVHEAGTRAVKYAVLFLALTFLTYFLFEVFATLRLHPLQYLSVGLANCMFYLLLLALGEHIGFGLAYVASATASILLLGGYSAAILQSWRRAAPMIAMLTAVYGYLYATLLAEDFALLGGTVGLFAILAAFMYLTRHVDWYATSLDGKPAEV